MDIEAMKRNLIIVGYKKNLYDMIRHMITILEVVHKDQPTEFYRKKMSEVTALMEDWYVILEALEKENEAK